jgi:serine protease Do
MRDLAIRRIVGFVSICLCALTLLGTCSDRDRARAQGVAAAEPAETQAPAGSLPNFVRLIAANGKSVVNVEVVQQAKEAAAGPGSQQDPLLDFYRRFGIPIPQPGPGQRGGPGGPAPRHGMGSGFIARSDGYILTNAHVVADADEVTIRLTDRREFQAKVIGSDPRTDVAVVKIDAQDLPAVRIGDPSQLQTGEWVVAIGSPFGLENSATAGIVSATSRAVGGESALPFIQTDVAVNPGNSGGPLFNMRGEVVGINSMIFSQTGGYMGLSFAIPIDVATNVLEQLITTGRVVHGRIGVAVQDVTAPLAQSFGLDRPRGALVSAVEGDGPAKAAGIQAGDVILRVDDQDIDRANQLADVISRLKPGSEAKLRVWHDKQEREVDVRIGELKQEVARGGARPAGEAESRLGMAVRPLTEQEKQQVNTTGNLVVERVEGPAALAGMQPGDIVLGINGHRVESVTELRDAVKDARNTVAVLVQRGNDQVFIPLRLG